MTGFAWEAFFASFGFPKEVLEKIAYVTVKSRTWQEYDRGVLGDEEVLEEFIRNAPEIEPQLRQVFQNVQGMVIREEFAIPWLKSLKKAGYHVYYLSNFSRIAHQQCKDALDFLPYMDGGILSYQDQVIKPQPEIYELLIARYQLKPQECVFLDDTPANLPPAKTLGMETILVTDHSQAVAALEKLGIRTDASGT